VPEVRDAACDLHSLAALVTYRHGLQSCTLLESARRTAQQHGHVRVVAAGMHLARLGRPEGFRVGRDVLLHDAAAIIFTMMVAT